MKKKCFNITMSETQLRDIILALSGIQSFNSFSKEQKQDFFHQIEIRVITLMDFILKSSIIIGTTDENNEEYKNFIHTMGVLSRSMDILPCIIEEKLQ